MSESFEGEAFVSGEELAQAVGITTVRVVRLVRLGLIEPVAPGSLMFGAESVARLRRMVRLQNDLGVNLVGAAIIVDLLRELERLTTESPRGRGSSG